MFPNSLKATATIAGTLVLLLSQTVFATTGSPILEKRTTSTSSSGAVRTFECLVYVDGATIKRNTVGIETTEEKNVKLGGTIDAKIADVAATQLQTRTIGTIEYSYSMKVFYKSASGARESAILSDFNGVTGEDIFNPSSSAVQLRDVLNSICGN